MSTDIACHVVPLRQLSILLFLDNGNLNFQRLVIAVNRRFILKSTKIASGKSPILPIHSPDGETILQTSTTNP